MFGEYRREILIVELKRVRSKLKHLTTLSKTSNVFWTKKKENIAITRQRDV